MKERHRLIIGCTVVMASSLALLLVRIAMVMDTDIPFKEHAFCLQYNWALLGPSIVSNLTIWIAYWSIPLMMWRYLKVRRDDDIPSWILKLYILFILLCGTGHLVKTATLFFPVYWYELAIDLCTAIASAGTVLALPYAARELWLRPTRKDLEGRIARLEAVESKLQEAEEDPSRRQAVRDAQASVAEMLEELKAMKGQLQLVEAPFSAHVT